MIPAMTLFFIPSTESPAVGVVLMTIAIGTTGFAYSGYAANPLDIASHSSSSLFSLSNTLATIPGYLLFCYIVSMIEFFTNIMLFNEYNY